MTIKNYYSATVPLKLHERLQHYIGMRAVEWAMAQAA